MAILSAISPSVTFVLDVFSRRLSISSTSICVILLVFGQLLPHPVEALLASALPVPLQAVVQCALHCDKARLQ